MRSSSSARCWACGCSARATPELRSGVVTFTVEGISPTDLAVALDGHGIAIRSGRHCAHPLHQRLGVPATARASFAIYNDLRDVDALVAGVAAVQRERLAPAPRPAARAVGVADCSAV